MESPLWTGVLAIFYETKTALLFYRTDYGLLRRDCIFSRQFWTSHLRHEKQANLRCTLKHISDCTPDSAVYSNKIMVLRKHFFNVVKNIQTRLCFPTSPWGIHWCLAVLPHTSRAALLMRNLGLVISALPSTSHSSSIHEEETAGTTLLPKHSQSLALFQAKANPAWSSWDHDRWVKDRNPAFSRTEQVPGETLHETRSSQKTFDHLCPTSMALIALLSFKSDS